MDARASSAWSRESTVGAQDLSVHPSAVRPREERHDPRDIARLAQALERDELDEMLDVRLALAIEEQRRRHRARRHAVHGDVSAAQLVGEHADETFDTGFRSDI